ncbi:hypothetical protein Msi02_19670 [Microbispora siamensis]|uniref:Uncharacterized protein n=1 Tax=Microbispora siamensis TaxID=564413 RepID=A0ABQ4GIG0_9ACTN|nr:hypothetical protein Msi02_19670 [Microbispora siamensis]
MPLGKDDGPAPPRGAAPETGGTISGGLPPGSCVREVARSKHAPVTERYGQVRTAEGTPRS